jgi:hypothetical protein
MKRIKFKTEHLQGLNTYLDICLLDSELIDGRTFTSLLHFHLQTIKHKLHVQALNIVYKARKSVSISFNYAELITLSYFFKRKELPAFLRCMEFELIGGL